MNQTEFQAKETMRTLFPYRIEFHPSHRTLSDSEQNMKQIEFQKFVNEKMVV